jgi:hypothetical protein
MGLWIALIAILPGFLIGLLLALVLTPFVSGLHLTSFSVFLVPALVTAALYIVAVAIVLRLCPLLPARAIGDRGRTVAETWRRTRGNTWRIFWGLLACTLPLMMLVQFIFRIAVGNPALQLLANGAPPTRIVVASVINIVTYLLTWPIAVSFLSLAYIHFFRRDQVGVFD